MNLSPFLEVVALVTALLCGLPLLLWHLAALAKWGIFADDGRVRGLAEEPQAITPNAP